MDKQKLNTKIEELFHCPDSWEPSPKDIKMSAQNIATFKCLAKSTTDIKNATKSFKKCSSVKDGHFTFNSEKINYTTNGIEWTFSTDFEINLLIASFSHDMNDHTAIQTLMPIHLYNGTAVRQFPYKFERIN